eukprot:TRINITY_DN24216_c0_g2_i1.p2 TRINITY_DN24216_c0_g2~~TRINITY_DN24216_c0_g2_i1.p2  ORF type:complete len:206 (+),score=33.39 TRINITY_DN24216_c0_g2_i1:212-829(+)
MIFSLICVPFSRVQELPTSHWRVFSATMQTRTSQKLRYQNGLTLMSNHTSNTFLPRDDDLLNVRKVLDKDITAFKQREPPKSLQLKGSPVQCTADDDQNAFAKSQKDFDVKKASEDLKRKVEATTLRYDKLKQRTDFNWFVRDSLSTSVPKVQKTNKNSSAQCASDIRGYIAVILTKKGILISSEKAAAEMVRIEKEKKVADEKK